MALLLDNPEGLVGGAIRSKYEEKYGEELIMPGRTKKSGKLMKFMLKIEGFVYLHVLGIRA